MTGRWVTSEKVIKAVTLNQKEDRVLTKTFGTLKLERKFAQNVLDLHLRAVRSNFRHLKEKVSKIKSNLTPEEITFLRQLEDQGLIKPMTTFNLNAAMKIASAARQLNMYPESMQRSRSAMYVRHSQKSMESDKLLPNRSNTDINLFPKRRNSTIGLCIDSPTFEKIERKDSIEAKIRPFTAAPCNSNIATTKNSCSKRPSSPYWLEHDKTYLSKVSFAFSQPSVGIAQHSSFSSHEPLEKNATHISRTQVPKDVKPSFVNTEDALETNLGTDLFEERRKELLHDEQLFYSNLQKRKSILVGKIDNYLQDNPQATFDNTINLLPLEIKQATNDGINKSLSDKSDDQIMSHCRRRFNLKESDFIHVGKGIENVRK